MAVSILVEHDVIAANDLDLNSGVQWGSRRVFDGDVDCRGDHLSLGDQHVAPAEHSMRSIGNLRRCEGYHARQQECSKKPDGHGATLQLRGAKRNQGHRLGKAIRHYVLIT